MSHSTPNDFDVVINGAGWIGCSLACMLADEGFQVALLEQHSLAAPILDDVRSIVLTYSSYQILQTLNIWPQLAEFATAIKNVHVSHRGHFGTAQFAATNLQLPILGYVVPAPAILRVLRDAVLLRKNITVLAPAQIEIIPSPTELVITHHNKKQIVSTQLLVAADGSHSKIRKMLQIATHQHDYQQTAIIAQVDVTATNVHTAYERLTAHGPLALLPRGGSRFGVAWTVKSEQATELLNIDDNTFLTKLQQAVGYRLGKLINLSARTSFPLHLLQAESFFQAGVVLLGNAAHTLHPIAGQGFNLGLRDAAALAEMIFIAREQQQNWGDTDLLQQYWQWREQDQRQIIRFTDQTVRLFANEYLSLFASIGLVSLNILPGLQRHLIKRLLGLAGKAPRLACGVPLNKMKIL